MDRLGCQRVEAPPPSCATMVRSAPRAASASSVARVALLIDVADGHLGRVAQAPERGLDPLAHQPIGLALRLEDLRSDIGGTLAEPDRQKGGGDTWIPTSSARRRRATPTAVTFDAQAILPASTRFEQSWRHRARVPRRLPAASGSMAQQSEPKRQSSELLRQDGRPCRTQVVSSFGQAAEIVERLAAHAVEIANAGRDRERQKRRAGAHEREQQEGAARAFAAGSATAKANTMPA